jgi:hypothetical protein
VYNSYTLLGALTDLFLMKNYAGTRVVANPEGGPKSILPDALV